MAKCKRVSRLFKSNVAIFALEIFEKTLFSDISSAFNMLVVIYNEMLTPGR